MSSCAGARAAGEVDCRERRKKEKEKKKRKEEEKRAAGKVARTISGAGTRKLASHKGAIFLNVEHPTCENTPKCQITSKRRSACKKGTERELKFTRKVGKTSLEKGLPSGHCPPPLYR